MSYDLGFTIRFAQQLNRRSFIASSATLLAMSKFTTGFGQISTPASQAEGDADALTVLKAAGQAILELETFTFTMRTTNGTSTIVDGIDLVSVVGAVRRPMDLSAVLTVRALVQTTQISAIAVDGDFYVQDPLNGGAWQNLGNASQLATMINPDWILLAAINLIQDARITSERDNTTLIEGFIDLSDTMLHLEAGETSTIEDFLASGPVDVAFWINKDNLIERTELYGPIFASESTDVEKLIELDKFNEPVEIELPGI